MEESILYFSVFQPFAQYRNPFTFSFAQTFPLPPKSAIVGMLQNATGDYYQDSYNDLRVSIHGVYQTIFWHYQHFIKGTPQFDGKKLIGGNDELLLYHSIKRSQRTPKSQQEIFHQRLHLFIRGETSTIEKIKSTLEKPRTSLYLGRSEDLIFIRNNPELVNPIKKTTLSDKRFKYGFYTNPLMPLDESCRLPLYYLPTQLKFLVEGKSLQELKDEPALRKKIVLNKKDDLKRDPKFAPFYYVDCQTSLFFKQEQKFDVFRVAGEDFYISEEFGWM